MSQLTRDERSDHEDEEEDEISTTEEEAEKNHKVGNGLAVHTELDKSGCFGCLSPPEDLCRSKTVRWVSVLKRTSHKRTDVGSGAARNAFHPSGGEEEKFKMCELFLQMIEDEPESEPCCWQCSERHEAQTETLLCFQCCQWQSSIALLVNRSHCLFL